MIKMLETKLTILIVEDNLGDYYLIKEYLLESFTNISIHHSTTLAQAIVILGKEKIDELAHSLQYRLRRNKYL
jgi:hypothetical protein